MRTTVHAADNIQFALAAMDAEVKASLALNRATLRALASLSPLLSSATDAALEEEADQALSPRTREVVEDVRMRIQRAPGEARIARAMERALQDAAERLATADEDDASAWSSVGRKPRANAA